MTVAPEFRPINQPGDEHLSQLVCAGCGAVYAGVEDAPELDICSPDCALGARRAISCEG